MLDVLIERKFLKDLVRIPKKQREFIEEFVFEYLPGRKTISDLNKIEKMEGYNNYYKSRFGDYRVGLYIEKNKIIVKRVLHRKEIYRYFP